MAWFEKEISYAKDSLSEVSEQAIDRAGERLTGVVKDGVAQAGQELREVIQHAGEEIDAKLDKITQELHNQRQFTKDDVRELVLQNAPAISVARRARELGMRSLRNDGIRVVLEGGTSLDEVMRVTQEDVLVD